MAQHKQQKRSKKNAPKHARVSDVSKNSPSLGVVASVALASTLAIAPFSAAHALEAAASQAPDATDNAPTPQSKAPAKAAAPHAKQVSFTVRDSDSNILPPLSVFAVDTKTPSPEKPSITPAVAELRSAVTSASGGPAASTLATGSQPASSSQPAPIPGAGGTSSSSPSTPTGAPDASTNNNAVIKPNTNNPEANTQKEANNQVKREEDKKKTYTFTVSYCVEGYHQKQLLQPTEFTFTDDELTKISDPNEQGLYIPVEETPGYRAQRGKYIKDGDKYVLDKTKDASVRSYIKIDRTLVEANINNITSTETNKIAHYFIEYRPKTITYYVRHMIQDPNDPDKFVEFTGINEQITIKDKQGQSQTIRVSKAKGVVGQNLYAQPVTIEGYTPEPNLVNSPIPDDDAYADADADDPSSANNKKKYLVLELRYLLNKHEVSYDTQGGTAIQSKVFYYGMKVDAVPEPTRKGYKLTGWKKLIKKNAHAQNPSDPQTPGIAVNSTLLEQMPDYDVRFVAQWKPEKEQAEYHINIWVQKADLPKPDDPTNMDNYDFIGQVKKEGKSDGIIQDADLNLTDDQIAHLAWPDKNLRGNIENQADFDKYFMEDKASEARTKALNKVEEPEYFGAKKCVRLRKFAPTAPPW